MLLDFRLLEPENKRWDSSCVLHHHSAGQNLIANTFFWSSSWVESSPCKFCILAGVPTFFLSCLFCFYDSTQVCILIRCSTIIVSCISSLPLMPERSFCVLAFNALFIVKHVNCTCSCLFICFPHLLYKIRDYNWSPTIGRQRCVEGQSVGFRFVQKPLMLWRSGLKTQDRRFWVGIEAGLACRSGSYWLLERDGQTGRQVQVSLPAVRGFWLADFGILKQEDETDSCVTLFAVTKWSLHCTSLRKVDKHQGW